MASSLSSSGGTLTKFSIRESCAVRSVLFELFSQLLKPTKHSVAGFEEIAKIVHCGLSQLHDALVGAFAPILATRNDWQI